MISPLFLTLQGGDVLAHWITDTKLLKSLVLKKLLINW